MGQPDRKIIAETLAQELGEIYPWAEGASALSSGSFGYTFLLRDGVTVAKLRSGRQEDETYEGHNLRCLSRMNDGHVLIPEFRHETRPFEFHGRSCVVTFMSHMKGSVSSEQEFNGSYEHLGEYVGCLHMLFNRAGQVSDGLRVSEQYKKANPSGLLRSKFSYVSSGLSKLRLLNEKSQQTLEKLLNSYLNIAPRKSWVHGDFGWHNILFHKNQPNVIDLGYMHPARHPEIEFYYFYPHHWDDLIKGYKSASGIELDRQLLASLDLMYYVGDVAEYLAHPQKNDRAFETAINMMVRRLTTPGKFYNANLPYGLEV